MLTLSGIPRLKLTLQSTKNTFCLQIKLKEHKEQVRKWVGTDKARSMEKPMPANLDNFLSFCNVHKIKSEVNSSRQSKKQTLLIFKREAFSFFITSRGLVLTDLPTSSLSSIIEPHVGLSKNKVHSSICTYVHLQSIHPSFSQSLLNATKPPYFNIALLMTFFLFCFIHKI